EEAPEADRPAWEPLAIRLERAFHAGDPETTRALLPEFLQEFAKEPLLTPVLSEGAEPRQVLRVRIAQTVLRALVVSLPRLGLLRETYRVLRTAFQMERPNRPAGRGITEFNHVFEAAFRAVVESVVASAEAWPEAQGGDEAIAGLLDDLTAPFAALWIEHA